MLNPLTIGFKAISAKDPAMLPMLTQKVFFSGRSSSIFVPGSWNGFLEQLTLFFLFP